MNNYIETIYNEKERPVTKYPFELAAYLTQRFQISSGSRLLDNGCGRGDFLHGFQKAGMEIYGTDIAEDPNMGEQKTNQNIFGGIDLENGTLPFPDDFFDVIFTKSVIEHIHKPEKFFRECYRVLKPGGRIIVMVPDWHSCLYIYYDDCTHVQPYTQVGLKDTLKIFDFQEITCEKFYQLPVVWKYPFLKIICKVLQLFGGPVKKIYKNKFIRFSKELMILGTGIKRNIINE